MAQSKRRAHDASPQKELLAALRDQLIPWAQNGALHSMTAAFPLSAPPEIEVCAQAAALLPHIKDRRRADSAVKSFALAHWKKPGLLTLRHLGFVFVLEGRADLRLGVTEHMAKHDARLDARHGRFVLRLPPRGFLAVPPETPFTDGMSAHWERGELPADEAHSTLLWLNFLPEGVMLHLCRTRGTSHVASPKHFVLNAHAAPIAKTISEMLQHPPAPGQAPPPEIALLHLQALLKSLEHALAAGASTRDASGQRIPHSNAADVAFAQLPPSSNAAIVQRACDYIAAHLTQPLSTPQIADYAYASVSHLNRVFRAELGTTVLKYVTARRVETIQSLLANTDLSISAISRHVGFRHVAHFSLFFTRNVGETPSSYRQRQRAGKGVVEPFSHSARNR